jgi:predicted nucleotide-binding protein
MKHQGSKDELLIIIKGCGFAILDTRDQEHGYQIRTQEGAIINWFPKTGTVQLQGKKEAVARLKDAWDAYTGIGNSLCGATPSEITDESHPSAGSAADNKKVFVVHGHDDTAREQLELVLHKLGLDPFVLANTGGGGLTIIEALECKIGPGSDQARFGIVLMTPDDMGYKKSDDPVNAQPRARQNVVLEMGMLISAVGRPNVAILKKGHVEVPSDAHGILYIPFNDHVKETVPKLADRLTAAGFILNPAAISKASS